MPAAHPELARPGLSGLGRAAVRAEQGNLPLQVLFELTGRCHLDCAHCYLDVHRPPKGELTTAEVFRVLAELRAAGAMFMTFSGGEAFLRKDLFEILAEARRLRFAVRLFTSGTLLRHEHIPLLQAIRPTAVELSVYGLHGATHDEVTGRRGSLRKTLRAAVLLRRAGLNVILKAPILERASDVHIDLPRAARRLGAGFRIDPSIVAARDGGDRPTRERATIATLAKVFAHPDYATGEPLSRPPPRDVAPCAIGRRVARIGPTGDVYPCSTFPGSAGNLRQASFQEIWGGSPVLTWLRGVTVGALEDECGDCSRMGYCGRCSSQALLEHGNFLGPVAEACDRAEAREQALGLPPPPGARRMGKRLDGAPTAPAPATFVPIAALRARRAR